MDLSDDLGASALQLVDRLKALEADPKLSGSDCSTAQILGELCQLVRTDVSIRLAVVSAGCPEYICKRFPSSESQEIHSLVCALLGHLAIDQSHCAVLINAGAISSLCRIMSSFPDSAEVQAVGCGALWNIAIDPRGETSLHDSAAGVIARALYSLEVHPMSEMVVTRAFGLLWNLAGTEENKNRVVENGGFMRTVDVLEAHLQEAGSQAVMESGCALLWHLTRNSDLTKQMISQSFREKDGQDVLPVLLQILDRYSSAPEVLGSVLGMLANVCGGDGKCTAEVMHGGADTTTNHGFCLLKTAASSNLSHEVVQAHASALIKAIAEAPEWRKVLVAEGALPELVRAMKQHPQSELVQSTCCGALWNIAADPDTKGAILNAEGVSAILDALKILPESEAVNSEACGALTHLMQDSECANFVMTHNGMELLSSCAVRHPNISAQVHVGILAMSWANLKQANHEDTAHFLTSLSNDISVRVQDMSPGNTNLPVTPDTEAPDSSKGNVTPEPTNRAEMNQLSPAELTTKRNEEESMFRSKFPGLFKGGAALSTAVKLRSLKLKKKTAGASP